MIRKSGNRFSEKIMLSMSGKAGPDLIRGGTRFSEKIMVKQNVREG
jgi:hypothetical protein